MKQHYIPRCYLRRFSKSKKSIFAFDKLSSKQYEASLMSVCCENDIYTISDWFIDENKDKNPKGTTPLTIEHQHFAHTIEPLFKNILDDIDIIKNEWANGKDHYILTYPEKKEIALHIITQYFRLPELKKSTVETAIKIEQASIDMVKSIMATQTGKKEFEELQVKLVCDEAALHASYTYLDEDTLMMFADVLANNYWIFWMSPLHEFYTSDFPIVVEPHVPNAEPLFMGLAQYGAELTFPLSPDIVVSIYDQKYFLDQKKADCHFLLANDKEVRRQNMLRYFYAVRHLFSYLNDFRLVKFIYDYNHGNHIFQHPNYKTEVYGSGKKY